MASVFPGRRLVGVVEGSEQGSMETGVRAEDAGLTVEEAAVAAVAAGFG
jgi:hypothetical protein